MNHISANIHEFGGAPIRPVGSHMVMVDKARDRWLQSSLKATLGSLQSTKVPREPILIAEN